MSPTAKTTAAKTTAAKTAAAKTADAKRSPASVRESEHVPPEDWAARGKAARQVAPRSSHAAWRPAAGRPDPVALLEEQARSRVPELVPIRHGRMLASPATFYRGAAFIMASDLAGSPASGFDVQLCGDAHLLNFGLFASPERQMLFDINDFDETLPGPWEWDVKCLAASFEIAGRHLGFSPADRRAVVAVARFTRLLARSPSLGLIVTEELLPGVEVWNDEDFLAFARQEGQSAYHPVGTCRLGHDPGAVVDPQLRVHGIAGLRIADASVMPTLVSGNTNAACMMIGEKASDLILADAQR